MDHDPLTTLRNAARIEAAATKQAKDLKDKIDGMMALLVENWHYCRSSRPAKPIPTLLAQMEALVGDAARCKCSLCIQCGVVKYTIQAQRVLAGEERI